MRYSIAICSLILSIALASASQAEEHVLTEFKTHRLTDEFYAEGATAGDYNHDGVGDIAAGPFWFAGPDFKERHAFYEPKAHDPHNYSSNFLSFTDDFNNDGWDDILVFSFPGQDASWFENPKGIDRFWPRHKVVDVVENESPALVDINGDGRRDIVCSQGEYFGFAEINQEDPRLPWKFRRISSKDAGTRYTHGLGVGDVNGDGRADLLEKNGWWEQPASLDGDPIWKRHQFQFSGPGGSQMYAHDFDGDGDNDVLTSLAAHGFGFAWYENLGTKDGEIDFKQHKIMGDLHSDSRYGIRFSQTHSVDIGDFDGDGLVDFVTGKRYWAHGPKGDKEPGAPAVLYWFRAVRTDDGIDFVPYLIDDDSGVGTQVDAVDINGDGQLDIVVGNKKGIFVHLQERRKVSRDEWQRSQPTPREDAAKPAQPDLPDNAGLLPAEAARAMTVPKGFQVQLAAGEPQVHQPVAMTLDARGRLWIAEAHTYPIRAPEGEGKDRIIILEDQDGDGTHETRKVFAEGLNLISGLEVGFGGVWVGAAPYLMFIADRDHDDVPDGEPDILLDGFGYHDTHETLNSFVWGPDGWLYGCHGIFTHSLVGKPGTPKDERTPLNAGIWRFHPQRQVFEVFAWGTSNPWGLDFDDHGQAFATSCVIPHLFHVIQGARYHRQAGQHFNPHVYDDIKTIADHAHYAGDIGDHAWWRGRDDAQSHRSTFAAGGGHAHCGAMIYLGDNFPDHYRNTIFMCNIHGNRVNNDILKRNGSGYIGSHGQDFLFANDRWFRGIDLTYGPDGGVYLIDWYDKNACHRRSPETWDRTNGRVYKVTYVGDEGLESTRRPNVDLEKLSLGELVALQAHPNDWYVRTARRLLQVSEPGLQVPALLWQMLEDEPSVPTKLRALWALHAINALDEAKAFPLLDSPHEHVRAWTIQLQLEDRQASSDFVAKLAEMAKKDSSPVVRLYLAAALQRLPLEDRYAIAAALAGRGDDGDDPNTPLMIWYGIEPLVAENPTWAIELAAKSKMEWLIRYIYRRASADEQGRELVLKSLINTEHPYRRKIHLDEMANAVRTQANVKMPAAWPVAYHHNWSIGGRDDIEAKMQADYLAVKFGDNTVRSSLRKTVTNTEATNKVRLQAIDTLITTGDATLAPLLHELLDDTVLRDTALRALARFDNQATATAILDRYSSFSSSQQADAIATLASRRHLAHALVDGIENGTIAREDLSAYLVRQMTELNDGKLTARLNSVWGNVRTTAAEKRRQIAAWKGRLTSADLAHADRAAGRALFNKTCASCHKLFDAGGDIGPNITGANRMNLNYLLENMIDPSAVVGKDYQMTLLVLADGRVLSGIVRSENETALTLQTVNEQIVVPLADLEERKQSTQSLMPEGQLLQMKPEEVRDLIAYLSGASQVPQEPK